MSEDNDLNEHGNHQGEFRQTVGGWAEYTVNLTEINDTIRHDVTIPPKKIIPVIFLPGVMGSNLRMSKIRQKELDKSDNIAWRPDDMLDAAGKMNAFEGNGTGGWFKTASPAQRQMALDPNETEVEYYAYTEKNGRFEPSGSITVASDTRHKNIPHDLPEVTPLITISKKKRAENVSYKSAGVLDSYLPPDVRETPAQIARWRGWSEVLFTGAYGEMLKTTEFFMNNIIKKGEVLSNWRQKSSKSERSSHPEITTTLMKNPQEFGASSGTAITDIDLKTIARCWYPVHAMGYNFLKSNADSAKTIAERIRGLVAGYEKCGFKCKEVILVTHSMGGLLARALIHPKYGNLIEDKKVKILGIYHNVMPSTGAAGAYKRMRFGFKEKFGIKSDIEAKILGIDGKHATAVLANAPAPLEMMPGAAYGSNWLKVVDAKDQVLWSWPSEKQTALDSIYLRPENNWWRLINPLWINPANISDGRGGGLENVKKKINRCFHFFKFDRKFFSHPNLC